MDEWSDAELEESVKAYREMERMNAEGRTYSKTDFYRGLAEQFQRSAKAFEYRMQNISAVLQENQEPWVPGLKPAGNVGANVRPRIEAMLEKHPKRRFKLPPQAPYKVKLPSMREWLIRVARSGQAVTYGQVMEAFGLDRFSLRAALGYLGYEARNLDEPILTALIVGKHTMRCGPGFAADFKVDDEAERRRLYDFWKARDLEPLAQVPGASLEVRSARFVSVEARPDQAAFRRRVFAACNGRCVISGCDVVPAIDAAHKKGRSWRLGHNAAEDGYILRKDLHALYDADLLCIESNGTVVIDPSILLQYGQLAGAKTELANSGSGPLEK